MIYVCQKQKQNSNQKDQKVSEIKPYLKDRNGKSTYAKIFSELLLTDEEEF